VSTWSSQPRKADGPWASNVAQTVTQDLPVACDTPKIIAYALKETTWPERLRLLPAAAGG
jgi:hypothetical protein